MELKTKQVVNTVDGKCLGRISDIIFDVATAKALGFVVPNQSGGFFNLFKADKGLFIPFDCVCKIGVDVILVELYIEQSKQKTKQKNNMGCMSVEQCAVSRGVAENKNS